MRRERTARAGSRVNPGLLTILVGVIALGFGISATWDLWSSPGGLFIGPNTPDAHHYLWWLGHTPHALSLGESPLATVDMNWPDGVSAMNNTTLLLPAVLLWPVTWLAGSLVSLNVLNILAIPLCTAGAYWALRQIPWEGGRTDTSGGVVDAGTAGAGGSAAAAQSTAAGQSAAAGGSAPVFGNAPAGQRAAAGGSTALGERPADDEGATAGEGSTAGEGWTAGDGSRAGDGSAAGDGSTGRPGVPAGRISEPAALVGAVAFAISPSIVNSLVGHITMSFAPLMPVLIALSVLAWYGNRPVRTGVLLGILATAQVFTGEEVLFQSVMGALVVVLVAALSRPRAIRAGAARLGKSLAVAFAIFIPITAYPLYLQFLGPRRQEGSPFLLDYYAADLTAFFTPTDRVLLHTEEQAARSATFPGGIEEHLAYLGWPLIAVCVLVTLIGWRRVAVRCAAAAMLVAAVLSVGARLWIGGVQTEHRGPYAIFQSLPVTEASLASRFGLMVALFSGALLAFAVQGLSNWRPRSGGRAAGGVLAAVVSFACLAPLVPVPLPVVVADEVPEYFRTTARQLPAEAVVLVLPYPEAAHAAGMRWQSAANYRFRMPGGYFLGPGPDGRAYIGGAADPPTALLLQQVANTGQPVVVTPELQQQALADLRTWGVDLIVLGPDYTTPLLRQTMSDLLGQAPQTIAGVDVWTSPVGG